MIMMVGWKAFFQGYFRCREVTRTVENIIDCVQAWISFLKNYLGIKSTNKTNNGT